MTRFLPLVALAALLLPSAAAQTGGNDLLVSQSFGPVQLCLNDGTGTYACEDVPGGGAQPRDFAVADFNSDGFNDFASANGNSNPNRICLADGEGGFTCSDVFPAEVNFTGVATADFDGVNGPDLAFSYANGSARVCLNNGTGVFSCSPISGQADFANDVETADLDGQNGPDLVFSSLGYYAMCLNNGSAGFSCASGSVPNGGYFTNLALGDLDGQNGPDIVLSSYVLFGGTRGNNIVCFNDGDASFSCRDVSANTDDNFGVAIGDLDGVNGPDLLFTRPEGSPQRCLNNGTGVFSCSDAPGAGGYFTQIAVGDIDGQPGLDYIAGSTQADPNSPTLCTNDGSGSFSCEILPVFQGSIVQFGEFGGAGAPPPPPAPPVDIRDSYATTDGALLVYTTVENTTDRNVRVRAILDITAPNGTTTKTYYSGSATVPAGTTVPNRRVFQIRIPRNAPDGVYSATLTALNIDTGMVVDTEDFTFTLSSAGLQSATLPGAMSLEAVEPGAAPNPFRDQTTFTYAVAEDAPVDLRVFDALGREVASLVTGTQAAGTHMATLQAGDLPGGVYVWRLAIGGEVSTGRITLAR